MCSRKEARQARNHLNGVLDAVLANLPASAPPPPPALPDVHEAAVQLLDACEATACLCVEPDLLGNVLRGLYGTTIAEGVPPDMAARLDKLK